MPSIQCPVQKIIVEYYDNIIDPPSSPQKNRNAAIQGLNQKAEDVCYGAFRRYIFNILKTNFFFCLDNSNQQYYSSSFGKFQFEALQIIRARKL